MTDTHTCVLTLTLDPASQAHFEALRQEWFPPERNQIPAHLTLFHTLPEERWVAEALHATAASQTPIALGAPEPRSIGRGVAFFFHASEAVTLHTRLRNRFADVATPQDRQGFRPHIVVMNKATSEAAKRCLAAMQHHRVPTEITATGVDLWRYLNGPWQHLQHFAFSQQQ